VGQRGITSWRESRSRVCYHSSFVINLRSAPSDQARLQGEADQVGAARAADPVPLGLGAGMGVGAGRGRRGDGRLGAGARDGGGYQLLDAVG
jgi:hypothetical protein